MLHLITYDKCINFDNTMNDIMIMRRYIDEPISLDSQILMKIYNLYALLMKSHQFLCVIYMFSTLT